MRIVARILGLVSIAFGVAAAVLLHAARLSPGYVDASGMLDEPFAATVVGHLALLASVALLGLALLIELVRWLWKPQGQG